jgi:hypothetical protein
LKKGHSLHSVGSGQGSAARLSRKGSVLGLKHANSLADGLMSGAASATSKASPGKVQGSPPGSAMKNFSKKLVKHAASPSPTKKGKL